MRAVRGLRTASYIFMFIFDVPAFMCFIMFNFCRDMVIIFYGMFQFLFFIINLLIFTF